MGKHKWADEHFGKTIRARREQRGWSQADMAKMLLDRGVDPMHSTTVAKIEAGDRSVRINEAVGIADLFDVSLDVLLGRGTGVQTNELAFQLRHLRDTARQSSDQVWASTETIREQLKRLPAGFEGADALHQLGDNTCRNFLYPTYDALMGLVNLSHELLRREQGEPESSGKPMETLLSDIFQSLQEMERQAADKGRR